MGDPEGGKPSLPASPATSREMTLGGEGAGPCVPTATGYVSAPGPREEGMLQRGQGEGYRTFRWLIVDPV